MRSEMDLRWGQGTLQLCSARVCPRLSHSETATSILLAFVGGGSHHLIWNRPDVNHDGDPIDGEEKKSEAGREGGGQQRETYRHWSSQKHQEQADDTVAFVAVPEPREDAEHHRDHIARLAFGRFQKSGFRGWRLQTLVCIS